MGLGSGLGFRFREIEEQYRVQGFGFRSGFRNFDVEGLGSTAQEVI